MDASIVDLRYNMKDVLKALARNESVTVHYHQKRIAKIVPTTNNTILDVKDHPFFGIDSDNKSSVKQEMNMLRKSRYHDL